MCVCVCVRCLPEGSVRTMEINVPGIENFQWDKSNVKWELHYRGQFEKFCRVVEKCQTKTIVSTSFSKNCAVHKSTQVPANFSNPPFQIGSLPFVIPFFFFSTAISSPSSRRQMILGVGKPSARQVMLMFWFSRTATEDGVLSMSSILGGTTERERERDHMSATKTMASWACYTYPQPADSQPGLSLDWCSLGTCNSRDHPDAPDSHAAATCCPCRWCCSVVCVRWHGDVWWVSSGDQCVSRPPMERGRETCEKCWVN